MLSTGQRRYGLALLAVIYMFNFVDRQILAILLPAIKAEFVVSDAFLGFLTGTAFALVYSVLGIPLGKYADRANRRNLIASALAFWSVMTAACGLANNVMQLLAARVGVGIGEAGCTPPAHSMIADMFPPEQRSTAMGIYTLGISFGIMLAYLAGGWVVQNIGWREALFIVGLPGVALAVVVRFTLREPQRGASEARTDSGKQPSYAEVLSFVKQQRSFIHLALAAGLMSLVGYAVVMFLPTFMSRSFGWGFARLGLWLGLILGIIGGAGYLLGGYMADRLGRSGARLSLRYLAVASIVSCLLFIAMFLATSAPAALWLFTLPILAMNAYLPQTYALTQSLVPLRMRAIASAIMLLVINLVGLAVGPWLAGILSDELQPQFGAESMRYSLLLISTVVLPWAGWHFFCSARCVESDLARAKQGD